MPLLAASATLIKAMCMLPWILTNVFYFGRGDFLITSHSSISAACGLQGADEAILVLAPMLLLLNQEQWEPSGTGPHQRRYAPCVAAVVAYLAASCLWQLAGSLRMAWDPIRPEDVRVWGGLLSIVRDFVALGLAVPHHLFFIQVSEHLQSSTAHFCCSSPQSMTVLGAA